jgi:hypothetical protein
VPHAGVIIPPGRELLAELQGLPRDAELVVFEADARTTESARSMTSSSRAADVRASRRLMLAGGQLSRVRRCLPDRRCTQPDQSGTLTSEQPPWEPCRHGGCAGVRLRSSDWCFAHAAEQAPDALDAELKRIHAEGRVDLRGVVISKELLSQVLQVMPQEKGRPVFTAARFDKAIFENDVVFIQQIFYGPARFGGASFQGHAWFSSATFYGETWFGGASFHGSASFGKANFRWPAGFDEARFAKKAEFDKARFAGEARFGRTQFTADAGFEDAWFAEGASFDRAAFSTNARFDGAEFLGAARFEAAEFTGNAQFMSAQFIGEARFDKARFTGDAQFDMAQFNGPTSFGESRLSKGAGFNQVQFAGPMWFTESYFGEDAWFDKAEFNGDASFNGTQFAGTAVFGETRFSGDAWFERAEFTKDALFSMAQFTSDAGFSEAHFIRDAWFDDAQFAGDARFDEAQFGGTVSFPRTQVAGDAQFRGARFARPLELGPLLVLGTLNLASARFGDTLAVAAAAARVRLDRAACAAEVSLQLRYAEVALDGARFVEPMTLGAADPFTWPTDLGPGGFDETTFALLERSPTLRLLSVRATDVAHLVLTDLSLAPCHFAGAHHLDQLRLEGTISFAQPPRGLRVGRTWPLVWWWTRRQTLAEEHTWRATSPKGTGWHGPKTQSPTWLAEATGPPRVIGPERLAGLYRALRQAQESRKNEPGAADFYYGEMEMRRLAATTPWAERVILFFYWLMAGYGLRGLRALTALGTVVVALAVLFHTVGFSPSRSVPSWWDSLLYTAGSTVSINDDTMRLTAWGKLLRILLRLLGPLLLGLALLSVRNRVRR